MRQLPKVAAHESRLFVIVVIRAKVGLKFHRKLVLLIAQVAEENFADFLHFFLNFLLTFSHHLDVHMHAAAGRSQQGNKTHTKEVGHLDKGSSPERNTDPFQEIPSPK